MLTAGDLLPALGSIRLQRTMLDHALPSLVILHHVGQFLALPELIDGYRSDRPSRRQRRVGGHWTSP